MKSITSKLMLLVVALVVIIGTYLVISQQRDSMSEPSEGSTGASEEMRDTSALSGYSGRMLGGTAQTPLLDLNETDYRKAVAERKYVMLFFYANWCPTCRIEFPRMADAFDGLESDRIIGFRVNYNDSDTDDFERALAREFGVAYQHTKVILEDGERIQKSPEGWSRDRYEDEINKLIQ